MTTLKTIAIAVRDELNNAVLSQTFTAVVVRVPEYDPVETADLKVFVLGLKERYTPETREMSRRDYEVTVAIYKRVDTESDEDSVDEFRQEVVNLLSANTRLTGYADAGLTAIANDPVYYPTVLDQNGVFVSVVTLTYTTYE